MQLNMQSKYVLSICNNFMGISGILKKNLQGSVIFYSR